MKPPAPVTSTFNCVCICSCMAFQQFESLPRRLLRGGGALIDISPRRDRVQPVSFDYPFRCRDHCLDRDVQHAFALDWVETLFGHHAAICIDARTARLARLEHVGRAASGGLPMSLRWTEQPDGRRTHRGADMHHSGIVAYEQVALPKYEGRPLNRAKIRRFHDLAVIETSKLVDQRAVRF